MAELRIGEVARQAGIATSAIRYYEAEGLIPRTIRRSGRRVYDESMVQRLALIDLAKKAGFTVAEIKKLLRGFSSRTPPGDRWRTLAATKLEQIEERMQDGPQQHDMATAREERLAKHKALEDEAKQLKSNLRAAEKKQDELVAAAREKISRDEARKVIIERLEKLLVQTYQSYLRADQRAALAEVENLYNKYAVTAEDIEQQRDAATAKLKGFLGELGYA